MNKKEKLDVIMNKIKICKEGWIYQEKLNNRQKELLEFVFDDLHDRQELGNIFCGDQEKIGEIIYIIYNAFIQGCDLILDDDDLPF